MKNIAIYGGWAFSAEGKNDTAFSKKDYGFERYAILRELLAKKNIEIHTSDITPIKSADLTIYINVPLEFPDGFKKEKSIFMLLECVAQWPHQWQKFLLEDENIYKNITWHTDLKQKSHKETNFFVSRLFSQFSIKNPLKDYIDNPKHYNDKKLCNIVNCNKKSPHSTELYSKRIEIIRWFENNALEEFSLYGRHWHRGELARKNKKAAQLLSSPLAYFLQLNKLLKNYIKPFPSYKGYIKDKFTTISNYKFSICFENAIIPGYITEKIFDCFFGKCIPIYLGAPDIEDFIPKNCYIDFRDFNNDYQKFYNHIANMNEKTHKEYLDNAKKYLTNKESYLFSHEKFAEDLVKVIVEKVTLR